jgi:phosphomannomutase
MKADESIFRAYDIRGVYGKTLDVDVMEKIGNVFRKFAGKKMIVGRDCRISSPALAAAFIRGITDAGVDVIDIGMVPRGAAMFWSWKSKITCAYVTASHLPPEWNGLKFVRPDGTSFTENESEQIKQMILKDDFSKAKKTGTVKAESVLDDYKKYLTGKIPEIGKRMRVLLDCGNGTAGLSAPGIFREKGLEVSTLFQEPDGRFPNRESEITEAALKKTKAEAKKYDVTIAFDGDADRISLIDDKGRVLNPEVTASLIMQELLKHEKGPVIANMESSKVIDRVAAGFGREVFRTPVGYAFVIKGIYENRGCFGIERSMHFCIPSIYPFDDGISSGLYAVFALSKTGLKLSEFLDRAPKFFSGTTNFEFASDREKFDVFRKTKESVLQEYNEVNTMDGVRIDFADSWILIRPSNTSPVIRLTVEAENKDRFNELKEKFEGLVKGMMGSSGSG